MGTNYYAVAPDVGRIHLGKLSAGWQFLAKADYEWHQKYALTLWIKRVINSRRVIDEYGDPIDKSDFLAMVFRNQQEKISHTEYMTEHYPVYSGDYWDCDGINFTCGEFS